MPLAFVTGLLTFIFALFVYACGNSREDILHEWLRKNPKVSSSAQAFELGDHFLFEQDFVDGQILYLDDGSFAYVLHKREGRYQRFSRGTDTLWIGPSNEADCSKGGKNQHVNWDWIEMQLKNVKPNHAEIYRALVDDCEVAGGIGALYVREQLYARIGKNNRKHHRLPAVPIATWLDGNLVVIAGLPAGGVVKDGLHQDKDVIVLRPETEDSGTYRRETVRPSSKVTVSRILSFTPPVLVLLWALLSFRFANTFADYKWLRLPLDIDAFVRRGRSRLIRAYLDRVRRDAEATLSDRNYVPLEWEVVESSKGLRAEGANVVVRRFLQTARTDASVLIVEGRGGSGKSLLLCHIVSEAVANNFIVIRFAASAFHSNGLEEWFESELKRSNLALRPGLVRELFPIYVIDEVSEVRPDRADAFQRALAESMRAGAPSIRLVLAGRQVQLSPPLPQHVKPLHIRPAPLDDDGIKKIAASILDPEGVSEEVQTFPDKVRRVMPNPNAFIVAHLADHFRRSAMGVMNKNDLFNIILERHLADKAPDLRPAVARQLLIGLVKANYVATQVRGLPRSDEVLHQVGDAIDRAELTKLYGADSVPTPVNFVARLEQSGLVFQAGDRWRFFHDSFEDWLSESASDSL